MITWIVQNYEEERRDGWNKAIQEACSDENHQFQSIKIVPFEHSVVGGDPIVNGKVVVHGSTTIFKVRDRCNWQPGVWSIPKESETHAAIGSHYLNHDMRVLNVDQVIPYVESIGLEFFFAKPDRDLKSFDGTVFDAEKFPFFIERAQTFSNYDPATQVCVSPIKNIGREWRIFVVNGEIAGYSQYKNNRKLDIVREISEEALAYARMITELYNPNDVHVFDVCENLDIDKFSVIEYNTFNCSGFYEADVNKITKSINHFMEKSS